MLVRGGYRVLYCGDAYTQIPTTVFVVQASNQRGATPKAEMTLELAG
jgi:hypothetical protein